LLQISNLHLKSESGSIWLSLENEKEEEQPATHLQINDAAPCRTVADGGKGQESNVLNEHIDKRFCFLKRLFYTKKTVKKNKQRL
jgi:hypothetical protein